MELNIKPPGAIFGIKVKARVAWVRSEGRRGFGVEFLYGSARKRQQMGRLVAQLKSKMLDELQLMMPNDPAR